MDTNKDIYQDSISEKNNPYLQVDQEEEEEDALSFCDLPIYSSKQEQTFPSSPRSSSSDQDLFEFFTQNWTHSSTNYPVSNIIFCRKLIPFKEPIENTNKILEADKEKKGPNRWVFQWNLKIFGRKSALAKKSNNGAKLRFVLGFKYGFSVLRVSIVTWPAKPRWQLLMFGLARFPAAEMEMSQIRNRQRRRSPSALFRLSRGGGDEEVKSVRGLCGLIRSFGCGGRLRHDDASAVVKA